MALVAACGAADSGSASGTPELTVSDAWSRAVTVDEHAGHGSGTPTVESSATVTSAVYFVIENDGDGPDQLLSASTPVADAAEIHQTTISNGVMQMRQMLEVEIPAGEEVVFEPAGLHVMLVGVHESLEVGDHFDVTLTFVTAGDLTISVEVRAL